LFFIYSHYRGSVGIKTKDIPIYTHDVDLFDRLKLPSIFQMSQEVADEQCSEYGIGRNSIIEEYNACYAITRMHIRMYRYPKSLSDFCISTWPSPNPKSIFTRYFTYEAHSGELLGAAVSQWVILNLDTRTIMKNDMINLSYPDTSDTIPIISKPPTVFYDFKPRNTVVRKPVYSDLDYNGHVNNAIYVQWICDLFEPHTYNERRIYTLDIKYRKEITYGNDVYIDYVDKKETNNFFVRGRTVDDITYFEATGTFQEVEVKFPIPLF